MAENTEKIHAGEFIISAPAGRRHVKNVTIASGEGVLPAGRVLAQLTGTGEYVTYDNGGAGGADTAKGILYEGVDATSAAVAAVSTEHDCEVNDALLDWNGQAQGAIDAGKAELSAQGIVFRPEA